MANTAAQVKRIVRNLKAEKDITRHLREIERLGDTAIPTLEIMANEYKYANAVTTALAYLYSQQRTDTQAAALRRLGEHPDPDVRKMVNLTLWRMRTGGA